MSDLNGTEANQSGLSANTADHSSSTTTTHQPVTTKDMAADIEQSNGHSLQDKTEAEALPSENKENGSLNVDEKPTEPTVEDKMDTTEDPKDSEPAKQPTAEASTGDKRVRDEDDIEHKPTDTTQEPSSEVAAVTEANTATAAAASTTAASTDEPITKEVKKQKTDADAAITDTAEETAPSADTTAPITTESAATEESTPKKKAGRPKKDETKVPSVTDEVKEAVETVSRRTRSRGSA